MADISLRIGRNVRASRHAKGYSQEQLAFKCKLHRTYISDIERGTRNVTVVNLEKVAKALDVKIRDLFD